MMIIGSAWGAVGVVFHPGCLIGRERLAGLESGADQVGWLRFEPIA